MIDIKFTLTTAAQKTVDTIRRIAKNAGLVKEKLSRDVAIDVAAVLVKGLESGEFPMPPLSPRYAMGRGGGPPLYRTGKYAKSFSPVQVGRGVWGLMGPMPLALFHEFGTKRMPARPHLRPAVKKVLKSVDLRRKFLEGLLDIQVSDGVVR